MGIDSPYCFKIHSQGQPQPHYHYYELNPSFIRRLISFSLDPAQNIPPKAAPINPHEKTS